MYFRIIKIAVFTVLTVCLCSCKDRDGNHPLYFKAGRELRNNNIQNAVTLYKQYLKINPDSAMAHKKLATIYDDRLNQPVNAIYHYKRYLELAPPDASDRDAIPKWIEASEHKYYLQLKDRFNDPEDINSLRFKLDKTGKALKNSQMRAAVYRKHLIMYAKKNQQLTDYLNRLKTEKGKFFSAPPAPVKIPEKEKFPVLDSSASPKIAGVSTEQPKAMDKETKKIKKASGQNQQSLNSVDSVIDSRRKIFIKQQQNNDKKYPMRASLNGPIKTGENEKTLLPAFYKVKKGDTLTEISRKFYGSGNYYTLILEANKHILSDASALQVGMNLKIPERKKR